MSLLKPYFEPTSEEREKGLKTPTRAHRAIAQLASQGAVRVIITTNFDRLMEQALDAAGVQPTVVSSTDHVSGMMPLQHNNCVVVKVHGDYLDTRIRNTEDELAAYENEMNELLDRVLTEYGLVVCGWSGDWDPALAGAVARTTRFRFSTYWMTVGTPSFRAADLIQRRRAIVVPMVSADNGFGLVLEKFEALSAERLRDPMDERMLLASVKRYLPDPRFRIAFDDAVVRELAAVAQKVSLERVPLSSPEPSQQTFVERVQYFDAATSGLCKCLCAGVYWGTDDHYALWQRCIAALARLELPSGTSYNAWSRLRFYPLNLLVYLAGMACLQRDNFGLLRQLLQTPTNVSEGKRVIALAGASRCLQHDASQWLFVHEEGRESRTPSSDWMYQKMNHHLAEVIGPDVQWEDSYDTFELFLTLVGTYEGTGRIKGRFTWRHFHWPSRQGDPLTALADDVARRGAEHPMLKAGFFKADPTAFAQTVARVREAAEKDAW